VFAVTIPAKNGGAVCGHEDGAVDLKPCNTCNSDCQGGWAPWGECSMVGRCRLTVSKPVLKALLVSALETKT